MVKRKINVEANRIAIFSLTAAVLSLILFSSAARFLGPETFAAQLKILVISWVLVSLLDFGSAFHFAKEIATESMSQDEVNIQIEIRSILYFIVSAPILLVGFVTNHRAVIEVVVLTFLGYIFQLSSIQSRSSGFASLAPLSSLVERAFSLITFLALEALNFGSLTLAISLGYLFGLFYMFHNNPKNFSLVKMHDLRNIRKGQLSFGVNSLIPQIQRLDVYLLSEVSSLQVAGIFGAVSRIINPLNLFSNSFSLSIFLPSSKKEISKQELRSIRKGARIIWLGVFVALLVAIFSSEIVQLLLGSQYRDSVIILQVMAISVIPTSFAQPLFTYIQLQGGAKSASVILLLGLVIQFFSILIFAPKYGAIAAALGFLVSQTLSLVLFLRKFYKLQSRNR